MDVLLQLQADQLQVDVVRPAMQETTAMGAAYLAGLAEGVWSLRDCEERWAVDRRVSPAVDRVEADEAHATWRRAVERSRGWANASDS
jgi:glycerol kinase